MRLPAIIDIPDGLDPTYPDYLRSRISLILLIITAALLAFFSLYNFILGDVLIASLELLAMITVLGVYFDYTFNHNLERLSNIVVLAMYAFFIPLILITQNDDYTLIWTIFFPLFAILVKGRNKGLFHSALFYTLILGAAYHGIGEWQEGIWNTRSFIRFTLASALMVIFMYYMDIVKVFVYDRMHTLIENEERHIAQLEELSNTDALTGLYNRRYLKKIFPYQHNLARRHRFTLGFFILDIDFFKQYNDTYGHLEGDKALQTIAALINAKMRRGTDYTFRLGGEEFGGLVIAKSPEQVVTQANNIKEAILAQAIPHATTGVLTVSIGVRIVTEPESESFDSIYSRADDALYRAKDAGRNTVIIDTLP